MGWFEHHHWWRMKSNIELTSSGATTGQMIVEECSCGAVRTIEIFPGKPPVVRTTVGEGGE